MRVRGNVLIPCESSPRVLEVLQILGRHWADNRLGLDHLVFLSPMANNTTEFARSQLEWMNDLLVQPFYDGRPNPFTLPSLKVCTTVRQVERLVGPKVKLRVMCLSSSFLPLFFVLACLATMLIHLQLQIQIRSQFLFFFFSLLLNPYFFFQGCARYRRFAFMRYGQRIITSLGRKPSLQGTFFFDRYFIKRILLLLFLLHHLLFHYLPPSAS